MKKILGLIAIMFAIASSSTVACAQTQYYRSSTNATVITNTAASPTDPFKLAPEEVKASIKSYGQGVYYFPMTDDSFGLALANFLKIHDQLEVTAMTGNVVRRLVNTTLPLDDKIHDKYNYGVTVGYFVTFRLKK